MLSTAGMLRFEKRKAHALETSKGDQAIEWADYDGGLHLWSQSMNFTVVILNEHVSAYVGITWSEWKDSNRKQMRSEGDNWSKATLEGNDIWDCLDRNKINRLHLVQWKPEADTLYKVSLPDR